MNARFKSRLSVPVPWALAFSFARAIQQPALDIWLGKEANVLPAQKALYHRASCNKAARRGAYNAALEIETDANDTAAGPRYRSSSEDVVSGR